MNDEFCAKFVCLAYFCPVFAVALFSDYNLFAGCKFENPELDIFGTMLLFKPFKFVKKF